MQCHAMPSPLPACNYRLSGECSWSVSHALVQRRLLIYFSKKCNSIIQNCILCEGRMMIWQAHCTSTRGSTNGSNSDSSGGRKVVAALHNTIDAGLSEGILHSLLLAVASVVNNGITKRQTSERWSIAWYYARTSACVEYEYNVIRCKCSTMPSEAECISLVSSSTTAAILHEFTSTQSVGKMFWDALLCDPLFLPSSSVSPRWSPAQHQSLSIRQRRARHLGMERSWRCPRYGTMRMGSC